MNKAVFIEELDNVGIITTSCEFTAAGYVMELKLHPAYATGWEELEHLPIVGLELAKTKSMGEYARKVLFVPNNIKEFKDYVKKHMKYFGFGKEQALNDLKDTINRYGTKYAKTELCGYLDRIGG